MLFHCYACVMMIGVDQFWRSVLLLVIVLIYHDLLFDRFLSIERCCIIQTESCHDGFSCPTILISRVERIYYE